MTIAPDAFGFVCDLVRRESAIVLGPGKEYLVESRLLPLARSAGAPDVTTYIGSIRSGRDRGASRDVVDALTTNETSWFRDGDPFSVLRQVVLPALLPTRPARRLRVWSAACSTGQEPYSIAMTVKDEPAMTGWSTEIVATDLSERVLTKARSGLYTQLEVNRGLPATHLVKHFVREGPMWRVSPTLTSMISFRELNLMRPFPPMGRFDVVMLRNVLIYFDTETKRDILRRVRQVMTPDGYLFLGAAEMTMGVDDAWERVSAGRSSVYRQRKELV